MNDYRPLTTEEIEVLKHNDCWAEDWTSVNVSEDFKPNFMHRVMLYGEINIGSFNKNVEVSQGFVKHSGINNATLRNVTIGDDCLIENVGNFINNYTIGDDCYISNISTMETTEGATYGEGNLVSVLNEVGERQHNPLQRSEQPAGSLHGEAFPGQGNEGENPPAHQDRHRQQDAGSGPDWQQCEDHQYQGDYQLRNQ